MILRDAPRLSKTSRSVNILGRRRHGQFLRGTANQVNITAFSVSRCSSRTPSAKRQEALEAAHAVWQVSFLHRPVNDRVSLTSVVLGSVAMILAVHSARRGLVPTWHDGTWERVTIVLAFVAPALAFANLRLWAGEPKTTSPPP